MTNESSNGAQPAEDDDADTRTPFERFEDLTRKILHVPKAELDERVKGSKETRLKERVARKAAKT